MEEMEERLFKLMFENMWFEELCKARKILNGLKNFSVSFWLTDCDGDENLWAEWFIKYYGTIKVDETFCSADIYYIVDYTTEKERIMTKHLKMSPYDNEGKEEAFWRVDSLSACELVDFAKKMQKLDKFFTAISNVSVPNEVDVDEKARRNRFIEFILLDVVGNPDEEHKDGTCVRYVDEEWERNIVYNYNGSSYEVLYLIAAKPSNRYERRVLQAYVVNDNEDTMFVDLEVFSTEDLLAMCKYLSPTYKSIYNLFKDGFDLPIRFNKTETIENMTRKCCLWGEPFEVGLSGDDELYVSVFVPNRTNPSHSYDFPLISLGNKNYDGFDGFDLITIRDSMKEMVKPTDYTFDVYIKVTCTAKGINEEEARKKVGEHAQVLANITEGKVVGVMNP